MENVRFLFRGKRSDDGKWVYGVPVDTFTNCFDEAVEIVQQIDYETDLEWSTHVHSDPVNPNTIDQCSGAFDIHGVDIFGGDIVKCRTQDDAEIVGNVYVDPFNGAQLHRTDTYELISLNHVRDIEIIGNVYDNPEMLEKK